MKIRVYTQPVNPFAEKVARALQLKQLPFELVVSNDPEDVKRWSPVTGQLPVLEADGERVADSNRILRWLDERFSEPPLLSKDPKTAAAQERLAVWSDTSFAWYWQQWLTARYPRPGDEQPPAPSVLGRLRGRSATSRAAAREATVVDELANRLDDLVGLLGDRPFFHADQISMADLSVYGMLLVARDGPMPTRRHIEERATLVRYMARVEAAIEGR